MQHAHDTRKRKECLCHENHEKLETRFGKFSNFLPQVY
uniref:Uncharacterized protein n=1 Tax=Rhizophora mucronata TaxID=61149 RepID=A0A2P2PET9_RHIMU